MSSRDRILKDTEANQPDFIPLPSWTWAANDNNVERFMQTLESIGGNVIMATDNDSIRKDIITTHGEGKRIASSVPSLTCGVDLNPNDETAESMEQIEVAIIAGAVGVAENGAVWIDGDSIGHRALPFICQHLVIIIHEHSIVSNMHQAYERIDVAAPGFGVFIAGPSKTADIEQSLVIGAHGARSLTVYIHS